jgi:DDE_Tnp_1-associated
LSEITAPRKDRIMDGPLLDSLVAALHVVPDPRKRRGRRHPASGLLALAFLGCLCRQAELAVLQRWAGKHWDVLRQPLGFDRPAPPHPTTLSRFLAALSLDSFRTAFVGWLADILARLPITTAAVDGKTSKQGRDADGDPIHVLNIFAHDLKIRLGEWAVGDGKDTEPEVLKAHLKEFFDRYPGLTLLSGDALFTQRPLAALIVEAGRHYLLAVKNNQPDMVEALDATFANVSRPADAKTVEKKGADRHTAVLD